MDHIVTRSDTYVSLQIGVMGEITGLSSGNYENGHLFQIKNDGDDPVTLEVNLASMEAGVFVETTFDVGWNPEIVRVIKQNSSAASYNLKYGF